MMNMVNVISRKNEFAGRIRIHDENQAPFTHIRIFLKTEIFPSVLAFGPHVNGVFENRKRRLSKNALQSAFSFVNVGLSFSCGRTKTEVFECNDVID